MRRLPPRLGLGAAVRRRLDAQTDAIKQAADHQTEADNRYRNARNAKWFVPVVAELQRLSGVGRRCMYCSGSEATDVEHYRPKSRYPALALTWENYLWACTPCNRSKGDQFPEADAQLVLNPLDDDVWRHFYIDERFGLLTPVFRPAEGGLDTRAVSTRDILHLNREAVQESRLKRVMDLKGRAAELLRRYRERVLTISEINDQLAAWREEPFQPDVADYFLNGPGREQSPFRELFDAVNAVVTNPPA